MITHSDVHLLTSYCPKLAGILATRAYIFCDPKKTRLPPPRSLSRCQLDTFLIRVLVGVVRPNEQHTWPKVEKKGTHARNAAIECSKPNATCHSSQQETLARDVHTEHVGSAKQVLCCVTNC